MAPIESSDSAGQPSERLVLQRMRNRAIEAIEAFVDGDDGVRAVGLDEYIESFFDIIDDQSPWHWRTWSVFTPDEVDALGLLHDLVLQACRETPTIIDDAEKFIGSGWPTRIQPLAKAALDLMTNRGRFSEVHEEPEPAR